MRVLRLALPLVLLAGLTGCERTEVTPAGLDGDYAMLTSVGNSFTAGHINSALSAQGQLASYPNLMSRQISGRDLTLPLVAAPGISSGQGPNGEGLGGLYVTSQGAISQHVLNGPPQNLLLRSRMLVPYENLGVPFAFAADALTATDSQTSIVAGNSFFDLILRNSLLAGNRTMLEQVADTQAAPYSRPEVMTVWIGNNDVLLGTLRGDPVEGVNLTPPATMEFLLTQIATAVRAMQVPRVVWGNIPSVVSIPYFTAVPLRPSSQNPDLKWNTDEADAVLVLLPAQALLFVNGAPNPEYLPGGSASLPSNLTLTQNEILVVESVVAAYNEIIDDIVEENAWAKADIHAALDALPKNPFAEGTLSTLNAAFPLLPGPGGPFQNANSTFGLDGVHGSEKGYAHTANLFLQALNDEYGTSYPPINVSAVRNLVGWEQFSAPVEATRAVAPLRGSLFNKAAARNLQRTWDALTPHLDRSP